MHLIGRQAHATKPSLVLPFSVISGQHCLISLHKENGTVVLADKSSNGTAVNGSHVGKGQTKVLQDGDVVTAAADLATGDLRFAVNGDWAAADATAFPNIAVPSDGLVPALTGGYGFVCTINLGDRPFKCRPPDASYRPVAPGVA